MATLQSTSITGTLTVNGAAVASRTAKFQEFTSSGTFTPSAALISAGGYIELFLVGGGGATTQTRSGANGGEVIFKNMYLTSTSNVAVTVAAAHAAGNAASGNTTTFAGASAGGVNVSALGGNYLKNQVSRQGSSWAADSQETGVGAAGTGALGYGAGGGYNETSSTTYGYVGIMIPKANSGQGGFYSRGGGSGYCLVKWFE